jgi:tRNA A37 threonylcarbamoyltransferase TsaD
VPERRFCTDNAAMIAAAADRQGEAVLADARTLSADPNLPFGFSPSPTLHSSGPGALWKV